MAGTSAVFGFELGKAFLGSVPFVASSRQELAVNNGIPKDYFLYGFQVRLTGRLAISGGTTNGTVAVNAPFNLVERFEISGNHKIYGDYTRFLWQGDHTYRIGNIYDRYAHENISSPALSGAANNYDFSVSYFIPFVPMEVRPEEQLLYLLDAPNWNTLQLYIDWGAAASLIVGGDRTLALSAFGSGTGTPSCRVTRVMAKLGDARASLNPIPIKQSYKGYDLINSQAAAYIATLNSGNFLRSVFLATGVKATGGSAASKGDNFSTMSDAIITRYQVKQDDVSMRDMDWPASQDYAGGKGDLPFQFPSGWNQIEFVEDKTVGTAFDSRDIAKQNLRFELWGDVTGAANQRLHVIYTEMAGLPVFSS